MFAMSVAEFTPLLLTAMTHPEREPLIPPDRERPVEVIIDVLRQYLPRDIRIVIETQADTPVAVVAHNNNPEQTEAVRVSFSQDLRWQDVSTPSYVTGAQIASALFHALPPSCSSPAKNPSPASTAHLL